MNSEATITVYQEWFRWGSQQLPYVLYSVWNDDTGKLDKFYVIPMVEMGR